MFARRQYNFHQLSRSYPILKHVNVYDRQSFIRQFVLDNVYICALMYVLFYVAVWYANVVIRRIQKTNKEMAKVVAENRTNLDDVVALKNKKAKYEEAVVKVRGTQKATSQHLETEMRKLSTELITTLLKMTELEELLEKYKSSGKSSRPASDNGSPKSDCPDGEPAADSVDDYKVLEPSFPPPAPPEPPRKYGIFVSRPPGQRCPSPTSASANSPAKIGFK